ncbi:MAG: hypothetical protein AAF213_03695 [Pseudomonadota bacterium]
METLVPIILGVVVLILVLSFVAPARVEYTEEILVNAPASQIYNDIRLQEHLMRWSAWPQETQSTCSVEDKDGVVGTKTIFYNAKGKRVGHQEVIGLKQDQEVALKLEGPGPPHHPALTFKLHPTGEQSTQVLAHFVNELPRPFNAIWKFAGLSNWTREMHKKDLEGLKAFAEPPHKDAAGTIVGYPPEGSNPFEHQKPA